VWQPPRHALSRGSPRVSQVPGGSLCAYAVFSDPGRTGHPLPWWRVGAAPVVSKTKAPAGNTLEAQSHGFGTGCLRFALAITGQDARLTSGCWLGFTGWDFVTHRIPTKGFEGVSVTSSPPSPSFAWRNDTLRKTKPFIHLHGNYIPSRWPRPWRAAFDGVDPWEERPTSQLIKGLLPVYMACKGLLSLSLANSTCPNCFT